MHALERGWAITLLQQNSQKSERQTDLILQIADAELEGVEDRRLIIGHILVLMCSLIFTTV